MPESVNSKSFGLKPIKGANPWSKAAEDRRRKERKLTPEQRQQIKQAKKEKWEAGAPAREERKAAFKQMLLDQQAAVKAMTPDERKDYYAKKGAKAAATLKANKAKQQAGLVFPVRKIAHNMRKEFGYIKFTDQSAVFMAAMLEYMTAEILELAGNVAEQAKKKRIVPRHLMLAVRADEEIEKVIGKHNVVLPGVGCEVKVNHCLVQKSASSMSVAYWDKHANTEGDFHDKPNKHQVKEEK